ncbi:MAG: MBL fold metallo-hydrolase [Candidatus Aminicenantes bacterium]|jgi:7,8-dihydropterin-6-yl-methyl-4-(beta-D-ribofuranosyl)aminobenzene 5'-phosphate synthase
MERKKQGKLTIAYDNNTTEKSLPADWGFSCLIQGFEKSILFDTGTKPEILLHNMGKLGIQPRRIDCVFLSHFHKDHTGGLSSLLELNPEIEVWLPEFFPEDFKAKIFASGVSIVEVTDHQKICEGISTTGIIKGWIKEQSLVLDTTDGLVVVTGCAHPRLTNILSKVKNLFDKNIFASLGGFHLAGFQKNEIEEVIQELKTLGVQKIGPCHCTGESARKMFSDVFKEHFIDVGVGREVIFR